MMKLYDFGDIIISKCLLTGVERIYDKDELVSTNGGVAVFVHKKEEDKNE